MEQLADTPEFRKFLEREFPEGASELPGGMNRRKFLTLMGASMAMAGLVSCRRPVEKIVPYVKAPEEIIPGIPKYYATTMPFGTGAYGLVVETHEGRPTKIEGNPRHPANLGTTNVFMQAAILGLYDPDRSQKVLEKGTEREWQNFVDFWQKLYPEITASKGKGLAILSTSSASPTLHRQKSEFLKAFSAAKWYTYEPVSAENSLEAIRTLSGAQLVPQYDTDNARVILSVDSDFLLTDPESIAHARGFASGRQIRSVKDDMNRLYAVESAFTVSGGMADHRKKLQTGSMTAFMIQLANALKEQNVDLGNIGMPAGEPVVDPDWVKALARDLASNKGRSLVVAGNHLPVTAHMLAVYLNNVLGNTGKTVSYRQSRYEMFSSSEDIKVLAGEIRQGNIETMVILGGNPVYGTPADLDFGQLIKNVKHTIHLGEFNDETAAAAEWHIPEAHFLEAWGDTQASDGTLGITQPMIAPLFGGKSTTELIYFLRTGAQQSGYELIRDTWRSLVSGSGFEEKWRKILHDGLLENTRIAVQSPQFNFNALNTRLNKNSAAATGSDNTVEVIFRPSPAVYDGRYANNGWLQELPDGVSKLTWDNAAHMSPETAARFNVRNEDVIVLEKNGRSLPLPVWVIPGYADNSVTVYLGYGRTAAGRIGTGVGFNANRLRSADEPEVMPGVSLRRTIETYALASTQDHGSMEGRPIVREAPIESYRKNPEFAREMVEHPPLESLWTEHSYEEGYQWGMTIDLNACTGCNACTIACQSENNIPIVGKEQVRNGREMHWLRMDRYFNGDTEEPEMVYQPVACQHCENAPCEQVCPVAATVHDSEGLNVMTYNRCIGTRYCSNNCPYKVRRFNFFNYTNQLPEIVKMAQNPDVTVRSRGVMEKCTYCVQRISEAKINARKEDRVLQDGEVVSACQQACPTNAIVFGNINDPQSRVSRMKKIDRSYDMLAELNVKPRTSYLARLRNPNPEIENS